MTYRSISAIVFAVIVALEIFIFVSQPTPTITNMNSKSMWDRYITDPEAQKNINSKFTLIIGATAIMGGIVTFSIPNTKLKTSHKDKSEEA